MNKIYIKVNILSDVISTVKYLNCPETVVSESKAVLIDDKTNVISLNISESLKDEIEELAVSKKITFDEMLIETLQETLKIINPSVKILTKNPNKKDYICVEFKMPYVRGKSK